jgi:hypothetical protein
LSVAKGFEKTAGPRLERAKLTGKSLLGSVGDFFKKRNLESLADKQMQLAFKSKPGYATAHIDRAEDYVRAAKGKS